MNSDPPFGIACLGLETLHTASRPRGPLSPCAGKSEEHRAGAITEQELPQRAANGKSKMLRKILGTLQGKETILGTAPYGARFVHFVASY